MTEATPTRHRVLVLGASGQVGSAFVRALGEAAVPAGRSIASPEAYAEWLHLDLQALTADHTLADGLASEQELTAIICASGATDVERCEADTEWASAANHTGPTVLAREAARAQIPFVFFSTDYVFDGAAGPYEEPDDTNPLSVYGRTKLEGERAVLAAHPGALIVRTTTVYGPDRQQKNFLYTLQRLLSSGQTMRVPTDQLATPTYNDDIAAATLAMMRFKAAGIIHIAGPECLSRFDFAQQACDILSLDASLLQPVETSELNQRAARPLLGGLSISTLKGLLGPDIMRSPSQGIRDWKASQVPSQPQQ